MVESELKATTELPGRIATAWTYLVGSPKHGEEGREGAGGNWGLTGTEKSFKISLKIDKQLKKKNAQNRKPSNKMISVQIHKLKSVKLDLTQKRKTSIFFLF